jgi:DNA-binding CsgD family transcriptional regulator
MKGNSGPSSWHKQTRSSLLTDQKRPNARQFPHTSFPMLNSFTSIPENHTVVSILEGLLDAVLIANSQGQVLYRNLSARKLCYQMNIHHLKTHGIWSICEFLTEHAHRDLILESELTIAEMPYRIRVQWLNVQEESEDDRLILRFENQHHFLHCATVFESQSFGLTQRESEVWELRRQNRSRCEIADELHISIDTVKKHLANIQIKRHNYLNQSS